MTGRAIAVAVAAVLLMAQTPAPPASKPPEAQDKRPPPPAREELIYSGEAASILGRMVRGPEGAAIGRIVDVLVGVAGQPRAAVIDVGGFMGMGTRRIAVAWRALQFIPDDWNGPVAIDMSVDQIKDVPEFKRESGPDAKPVIVAAPPDSPAEPPPNKAATTK